MPIGYSMSTFKKTLLQSEHDRVYSKTESPKTETSTTVDRRNDYYSGCKK